MILNQQNNWAKQWFFSLEYQKAKKTASRARLQIPRIQLLFAPRSEIKQTN